jgi:hypothetical protein
MSKPGLDGRHRNKDGEISGKHGITLVRTLRKVYGQGFAAGYPETAKLSEARLPPASMEGFRPPRSFLRPSSTARPFISMPEP